MEETSLGMITYLWNLSLQYNKIRFSIRSNKIDMYLMKQ